VNPSQHDDKSVDRISTVGHHPLVVITPSGIDGHVSIT